MKDMTVQQLLDLGAHVTVDFHLADFDTTKKEALSTFLAYIPKRARFQEYIDKNTNVLVYKDGYFKANSHYVYLNNVEKSRATNTTKKDISL